MLPFSNSLKIKRRLKKWKKLYFYSFFLQNQMRGKKNTSLKPYFMRLWRGG